MIQATFIILPFLNVFENVDIGPTVAPPGECHPKQFDCKAENGTQCIKMVKVCNGVPNCWNGNDEKNCSKYSFLKFILNGIDLKITLALF